MKRLLTPLFAPLFLLLASCARFAPLFLLLASCASTPASHQPSPTVPGAAVGEKIYNLGELDQLPTIKGRRAAPIYPFELKKKGIQGGALVRFVVDLQGKVRDIEIIQADHPGFAQAASDAVGKWEFNPGKKNGVLVYTRMQLPISFNLNR